MRPAAAAELIAPARRRLRAAPAVARPRDLARQRLPPPPRGRPVRRPWACDGPSPRCYVVFPDWFNLYEVQETQVSGEIERWLESEGDKTLGSIIELFEQKSFALLFILLLGVSALPLPTGGATHVFEIVAMLLAIQLIAGRDHIWLPERWRRLPLAGPTKQRFIDRLIRVIRWLERFSRPRATFLFDHRLSNIVFGALVLAGSLAAFLAPPFSGLDTLPVAGRCAAVAWRGPGGSGDRGARGRRGHRRRAARTRSRAGGRGQHREASSNPGQHQWTHGRGGWTARSSSSPETLRGFQRERSTNGHNSPSRRRPPRRREAVRRRSHRLRARPRRALWQQRRQYLKVHSNWGPPRPTSRRAPAASGSASATTGPIPTGSS